METLSDLPHSFTRTHSLHKVSREKSDFVSTLPLTHTHTRWSETVTMVTPHQDGSEIFCSLCQMSHNTLHQIKYASNLSKDEFYHLFLFFMSLLRFFSLEKQNPCRQVKLSPCRLCALNLSLVLHDSMDSQQVSTHGKLISRIKTCSKTLSLLGLSLRSYST